MEPATTKSFVRIRDRAFLAQYIMQFFIRDRAHPVVKYSCEFRRVAVAAG